MELTRPVNCSQSRILDHVLIFWDWKHSQHGWKTVSSFRILSLGTSGYEKYIKAIGTFKYNLTFAHVFANMNVSNVVSPIDDVSESRR